MGLMEKVAHVAAHKAMESAGCMVNLIVIITGVGTVTTLVGMLLFA